RHTRCLSDWSSDVCSSDLKSLEVIGVGAGKAGVTGCEPHYTIGEIEQPENCLGVSGEKLELGFRGLRCDVAHELHLVEFVDTEQATRVLPRRPGLTPEAGR